MIDAKSVRSGATAAMLDDDLFRRAGVRHPDALALADPPNRDAFAWVLRAGSASRRPIARFRRVRQGCAVSDCRPTAWWPCTCQIR
jgi:hypothetical protein